MDLSRSVSRIKRMGAIIPPESSNDFASAAMSLIYLKTPHELHEGAQKIRNQWPNTRSWLDWWVHGDAGRTLFQSTRTMPKDIAERLPKTTNAQESLHRQYYMTAAKNQSILSGRYSSQLNIPSSFRSSGH